MNQNKLILKNAFFLYVRIIFSIGISLFSSRIILKELGVVDYGIYSVVGSVVVVIGFLNSSLSGATNRFLSVSQVDNLIENKRKVFNTCSIIHFLIAIGVVVFLEIFGTYFIKYSVNIPLSKINEALIVFHLSVASVFFLITKIPFESALISNEKMTAYAYISIFESTLKVVFAFILIYAPFNKLIFYAATVLISSVIIRIITVLYCLYSFQECRFRFIFDKHLGKKIAKFFIFDLYGNMSVVAKTSGLDIVQNRFFGVVFNASSAVNNQVVGAMTLLSQSFLSAVKPQIFKNYASGNIDRVVFLISMVSKYSCFLILIVSIPIYLNLDYILNLWLENPPLYANQLIKITIGINLINSFFSPYIYVIHASGRVGKLSFITGTNYILILPISYMMLTLFLDPIIPYFISISVSLINGVIIFILSKKLIPILSFKHFIAKILLKNMFLIFILFYILNIISEFMKISSIASFICFSILSTMIIIICVYLFVADIEIKRQIKCRALSFLNNINLAKVR